MTKSLSFWIILLGAWVLLGSFVCHEFICLDNKALVGDAISSNTLSDDNSTEWQIGEGSLFSSTASGYIQFNNSSVENQPLSESVQAIVSETIDFLKSNPDKQITITGRYMSDEENKSSFSNLGLARADHLKQMMEGSGVSEAQMSIMSELVDEENDNNAEVLVQGAQFTFSETDSGDNDINLEEIESELRGKTVTIYFQSGNSEIVLNSEQRQDLTDIVDYVTKVPGSVLSITGHTDNTGSLPMNMDLSEKRSMSVKAKIMSEFTTMKEERFDIKGLGPNVPIADNNTEQGKAKNRRVEIVLDRIDSE